MKYILFVWIFVFPCFIFSQSYRTAAGFRIGKDIGLSISQRIVPQKTIDLYHEPGLFTDRNKTGLMFKQHYPILTKRLNFFGGIGLYYQSLSLLSKIDEPAPSINSSGVMLAGGIDFTVGKLNLGFDIMPEVRLFGNNNTSRIASSSAITFRYVIIPQKSKSKSFFQFFKNRRNRKK